MLEPKEAATSDLTESAFSWKFACRILHKSRPWDRIGRSSSDPTHSSQHYMSWRWIDMRETVFCSALSATDYKPTK
jgi:hypothetical protein